MLERPGEDQAGEGGHGELRFLWCSAKLLFTKAYSNLHVSRFHQIRRSLRKADVLKVQSTGATITSE